MDFLLVFVGIVVLIFLVAVVNAVLNIARDTKVIKDILIDWEKGREKHN